MASMKSQQAEGQMTSSNDREQEYQAAQKAYIQGNYPEAATLVDRLVERFPADPSSRLLRGHIYCILEQYNVAREQYQEVMHLTGDQDLVDCANSGLEAVNQYEIQESSPNSFASQEQELENTFLTLGPESQSISSQQSVPLAADFTDPTSFDLPATKKVWSSLLSSGDNSKKLFFAPMPKGSSVELGAGKWEVSSSSSWELSQANGLAEV